MRASWVGPLSLLSLTSLLSLLGGCWGGVYVTTAPIVDTRGQGGAIVRVGGTIGLQPEKPTQRAFSGHLSLDAGGLGGSDEFYLGGGAVGGARVGLNVLRQFPKWSLAFDLDAILYGRSINHTLYGLGLTGHLLPTLVEQVHRRYNLGVSILSDFWAESGVRGVFGLGITFSFTDLTPQR